MKMKNYKKSLLTSMFACSLFLNAFAQTSPFAGGSGTKKDPYLIETPRQFDAIRDYRDKNFKLNADLDFTGYLREDGGAWWPVGEWGSGDNAAERFSGTFNGNGHKIKNLVVERTASDLSIFGVTDGAQISNLIVEGCEITGEGRLGVLTGATFRTEIDQVAVISSKCLNTLSDHGSNAGGITGPLFAGSTITNSYSIGGKVFGKDAIGGVCSQINDGSTISNCYTTCDVEGNTNVGGITGNTNGGYILNSVAINTAITCHDVNDGRIAGTVNGSNLLSNNYAYRYTTVNGGVNGEMVTDVSVNAKNGANATEDELTSVSFYATNLTWDIAADNSTVWKVDATIFKYPVLSWQTEGPGSGIVNVEEQNANKYKVFVIGNSVVVNNLQANDDVSVYSLSGTLVGRSKAINSTESIPVTNNGLYVVKIASQGQSYIFKAIKR